MSKSVLTGAKPASFKGVNFNANLVEWTDSRKVRLAVHQMAKRDGAFVESMGREPHRVKMNIVYLGSTWLDDYKRLQATIDEYPIGTLVHPIIGSMNAATEGPEGATVNTETGRDMYVVPISFVEAELDQKITARDQGLSAQQQNVTTYCTALTALSSTFVKSAVAISALTTAALSLSSSAFTAYSTATLDPTLTNQLAALRIYTADCVTSLVTNAGAATAFPATSLAEQIYDACSQMLSTVSSARAVLISYTVPTQIDLAVLAARFYGKDAKNRVEEILTNNPGKCPNPFAIAPGTVLLLSPPTIKFQ